ncbi:hypothetical protein ACVIF9_008204 [Bradyrhizobium sp. USDA 4350]
MGLDRGDAAMRNAIVPPIAAFGPVRRCRRPRAGQGYSRKSRSGYAGASWRDRLSPAGSDETRSPSGNSRHRTTPRRPHRRPRRPNRVSSSDTTMPTQGHAGHGPAPTTPPNASPPQSARRCPNTAVKTLLRPKQDSRILKRSGVLVDPRSAHRTGHGAVIIKSRLQQHSDQIIPRPQQSCQTFTRSLAH